MYWTSLDLTGLVTLLPADYVDVHLDTDGSGQMLVSWNEPHGSSGSEVGSSVNGGYWTMVSVNALQSGGNTIPIVKTAFCAHYQVFDDGGQALSDRVLGRWAVRDQTGVLGITALQDLGRFVQPGDVGSSTTATVYSFNVHLGVRFQTNTKAHLEVRKYTADTQTYSILANLRDQPNPAVTPWQYWTSLDLSGLVTLLPGDYVDVHIDTDGSGVMYVSWNEAHGSSGSEHASDAADGGYWTMVEV
jgi:hypothetical protein